MPRTGSCYCGNVAYELDDSNDDGIICYCDTCQKLHTDHSLNLKSEQSKMKITKGKPKVYDDNGTDSGKTIHRNFCGDCGSHLFSDPDSIPGVRFVKVGSLDDRKNVKLVGEIYCESAMKHNVIPKERFGQKHFEGMMAKEI